MSIPDLVAQAEREIASAGDEAALEQLKVKYLGRKGVFKDLVGKIPTLPPAERGPYGKELNVAKAAVEGALEARQAALRQAGGGRRGTFDPTLPGVPLERGSLHPVTQVWQELLEVFGKLGFRLAAGPEIERPFFNFDALNIPPEHPARGPADNFFLDQTARKVQRGAGASVRDQARSSDGKAEGPGGGSGGGRSSPPPHDEAEPLLLRSQTSTIQIRALTREKAHPGDWGGPPLRVVGPGRVYRPDAVDATHFFQFHQIEGLVVEEGTSFADLKTVLLLFAREMFGEDVDVRLRPSFFPFTEPSAEFDIRCWICHGKGCSTCKQSGWVELGGCGMVDPNVFAAVGLDPERWTGYAFGFGIERLAMIRYGVRDLRLFTENDVRFLKQLA